MDIAFFFLSFAVILAGCELFTNGVEWAGRKFNLSEGMIGSVLAAIGTALPETVVPIIAILLLGGSSGQDIGVGAILGSPFMLATLALFVCGLSVLLFSKRRGRRVLSISGHLIRRDLIFFLIAYSLAALAALSPLEFWWFKTALGFSLLPLYGVYLYYTCKLGEGCLAEGEELKSLYCHRAVKRCFGRKGNEAECLGDPSVEDIDHSEGIKSPSALLIIIQIVGSLALIIIGANMFVEQISLASGDIRVPALLIALIVAPIATELPEMFNSMIWIRTGKDTFAIGNITGAMVFQSCVPVTVGILFTDWHIDVGGPVQILKIASISIALLSAVILYLRSYRSDIKISGLMLGGVLYAAFFTLVFFSL